MLHDIAAAVTAHGADVGLGFDGDGDRCGVVDNEGNEIFADKVGLMLARDLSALHKGARFVVDVKSTCLYEQDEVLAANGASTDYFKTGHSLHQAPGAGARRAGRIREVVSFLLQPAGGPRL